MKLSQSYILFMSSGENNGTSTNSNTSYLSTYGKRMFAPRSGQSSQGAAGKTNEIGASAADYIYDAEGLQKIQMNIIGDPAWLLQGESYVLDSALTVGEPFLPDGTINADAAQILFELIINTPQDYNLETGLMDPNTRPTLYKTLQTAAPGMSAQSYICRADSITSEFNQGKFTQRLVGQTIQYNPDQTVKQQQLSNRAAEITKAMSPGSRVNPNSGAPAGQTQNTQPVTATTQPGAPTNNQPNPKPLPAQQNTRPQSNGDISPANNAVLNGALGTNVNSVAPPVISNQNNNALGANTPTLFSPQTINRET